MRLLNDEKAFLEKRRRFVRFWRYVGPSLFFLVAGTGGWLYFRYPLLANPAHVVAELQRGGINPQTVEFMAVLLPVAIALILFLCGVFVLLTFASFANERTYLEVITREAEDFSETPSNSLTRQP
jgi:hypothetical protein